VTGLVAGRERLALALDLDDFDDARTLAQRLLPWFGVAKVGLELYMQAGPRAVEQLVEDGFDVFIDVKLHDIPVTVRRAATVLGTLGARYVTLHACGGEVMLRAGVEGLCAGAAAAGRVAPLALGVTVLTSEVKADPGVLRERVETAAVAGCGGIVCASPDLAVIVDVAPTLLRIVPGTRLASTSTDDQARVATPAEALANGADLLVVGRPVTRALDPERAAAEILASIASLSATTDVPSSESD